MAIELPEKQIRVVAPSLLEDIGGGQEIGTRVDKSRCDQRAAGVLVVVLLDGINLRICGQPETIA